jgi:hypothetical protein
MTEEEDKTFSLELDSALDDEFAEEEDFSSSAELLLDFILLLDSESELGMTEEEDEFVEEEDEFVEEEDFSSSTELLLDFTLLLDSGSESGMTDEEDGSSSFGATLLLLSSPHAARNAPNIKEIATTTHSSWQAPFVLAMTFRIRTPSPQWSDLSFDKCNHS